MHYVTLVELQVLSLLTTLEQLHYALVKGVENLLVDDENFVDTVKTLD